MPAASRLVSTLLADGAPRRTKSVPKSGDAAGTSACATLADELVVMPLHHLAHLERGVLHRGQVLDERLQFRAYGFVGDLFKEAGFAEFLAALPELVSQPLLDARRGPHQPRQAAIGADEFAGKRVERADADESRRLLPASGHLRQRGKRHADGGLPGVIAIHNHDPAGPRQYARDALEAAARGHGIVDHRIGGESLEDAVRGAADKIVDAFP